MTSIAIGSAKYPHPLAKRPGVRFPQALLAGTPLAPQSGARSPHSKKPSPTREASWSAVARHRFRQGSPLAPPKRRQVAALPKALPLAKRLGVRLRWTSALERNADSPYQSGARAAALQENPHPFAKRLGVRWPDTAFRRIAVCPCQSGSQVCRTWLLKLGYNLFEFRKEDGRRVDRGSYPRSRRVR